MAVLVYKKKVISGPTEAADAVEKGVEKPVTSDAVSEALEDVIKIKSDGLTGADDLWFKENCVKYFRRSIPDLNNGYYTIQCLNWISKDNNVVAEVRAVQILYNSLSTGSSDLYMRKGKWNNGDNDITWTSWEKVVTGTELSNYGRKYSYRQNITIPANAVSVNIATLSEKPSSDIYFPVFANNAYTIYNYIYGKLDTNGVLSIIRQIQNISSSLSMTVAFNICY